MTIDPNGKVGIGTGSPVRSLDVVGDASISGTLSVGMLLGGGLSGMQEFTNDANIPSAVYTWTAPPGVTRVLVEMWSGGWGGDLFGGIGGGYARGVVTVAPA